MTIMLAQYFLPLGVMSVTYSSIAYVVWLKRQVPGEAVAPRDHKIAASKKKVYSPLTLYALQTPTCSLFLVFALP